MIVPYLFSFLIVLFSQSIALAGTLNISISGVSGGLTSGTMDVGETFRKSDPAYYTRRACADQTVTGARINLPESVRIRSLGSGEYQIRFRLRKVSGFGTADESGTLPGSFFLQTCQVYTPQVSSDERSWTVKAENGMIHFVKTFDGKTLTIQGD